MTPVSDWPDAAVHIAGMIALISLAVALFWGISRS
jgi:hypothetical protein